MTNFELNVSMDNENYLNISITNSGSAGQESLETEIIATLTADEGELINISYYQTLEFIDKIEDIVHLDETNCLLLNNCTKEQIQILMNALSARIQTVFEEKKEKIFELFESSNYDVNQTNDINGIVNDTTSENQDLLNSSGEDNITSNEADITNNGQLNVPTI